MRYSSYNMWLHECTYDVWDYYWWAHLDATLIWDLPWYLGCEICSMIEVDYDASMASCEARWRMCLENFLSMIWIWHGYIAMPKSGIWLEENPIYIVGTEILSYIETIQLYETSLGLWLDPPWDGGWIWYIFVIYMMLCSNIIFDLMTYMNRRQLPLLIDDQVDTKYEFDESIIDWGHWANSSSPVSAPRVWNWDRGLLGLRELLKIGYHPYLLQGLRWCSPIFIGSESVLWVYNPSLLWCICSTILFLRVIIGKINRQ